jgi:hypothetical protein
VRFHAEHHFTASTEAVITLLSTPGFYLDLDLPDLSRPELLDHHQNGDVAVVHLRYEFEGHLDPIAQGLLGSSRLAWIQEVRVDRAAEAGTIGFHAEKGPRKLHGTADFVVVASGDGSLRRLDGELVVAVPGIGRMAERRIVPGVAARLDIEARAVEDQVGRGE